MEGQRYPLSWPHGWPRNTRRGSSNFRTGRDRVTLSDAFARLENEMGRLGVRETDVLMSSNLVLGMRGMPLANQAQPADPGVAVYFKLKGKDRVLACDRWLTAQENIAAIAGHIDAMRKMDRYGVGTIDQAFAGYTSLPPPNADNRPPWRGMLGFPPTAQVTADDIKVAYRAHAKNAANDQGALLQLNLARDAALAEIGA